MEIVAVPQPPVARAGTLLAAAHTPNDTLTRAVLTGYRASACGGWALVDPCGGADDIDHGVDGDPAGAVVSAVPFDIEVAEVCSTFGLDDQILQQRATDRMRTIASAAIAHELWTGEMATAANADSETDWANNPRLVAGSDVTDLTPGGGPVSAVLGLALLEDALGDVLDGQPGTVHCTKGAATIMGRPCSLYRSGDLLLTLLDTRVIADAGYPGTGPDGSAPNAGEFWLYGTAQPTVRTGNVYIEPLTMAQALDRTVNTVHYDAHQLAWAAFPCGVLAVRITTNEGDISS